MESQVIVVIEDEEAHLRLMERVLRKELSPHSLLHFADAASCLDKLEEITPKIIIVDFLLPGMNGIEFLEALRRMRKAIPVIMITGQGDENVALLIIWSNPLIFLHYSPARSKRSSVRSNLKIP